MSLVAITAMLFKRGDLRKDFCEGICCGPQTNNPLNWLVTFWLKIMLGRIPSLFFLPLNSAQSKIEAIYDSSTGFRTCLTQPKGRFACHRGMLGLLD